MSQAAEKSNNNNRNNKYYKKERHDHGDSNDNKSGNDVRAGKPNPKNFKGKKNPNLLDDSKEQAELKALYDKIAAEKKKIIEVTDNIQGFKDSRKGGQGNRGQGAGGKKKTLLQKKNELFQAINHLKAQRETIKGQLDAIKLPIPNPKKDQPIAEFIELNLAEFNKQISSIEKSIQFGNISLAEEKRKISELEKIKKSRGSVEEYRRRAEEFQIIKSAMKEKTDEVKLVKAELDEIFNSEKAQNEEFDKKKKSDEEKQQYYQSLLDQKAQHQTNIKNIRDQATAKKEEIDAKWAAWKVEQGVLKEKRHEEYLLRKVENEKKHKEYLENKAKRILEEEEERKKEEESKLPFSDDIIRADFLLTYLAGLRFNKNKPNLQIKHNIDIYVHFEEFSISPPCVAKDIEGVKTKIQQKKENLLEKQKAEVVRREELKQQQAQNEPAQENQPKESEPEVKNENAAEVKVEEETPSN